MQITYSRLNQGAFLVFIQNIIYFLYLYTKSYIFLTLYFLFIIPLFFLVDFKRKYVGYYFFGVGVFILFFLTSIFSQEYSFFISWYNLLYACAALFCAYFFVNSEKGLFYSKLSFVLYAIFLSYFIFKFGGDGAAYNEILEGSSRNYLSAISIFLTVNIYVQLLFRGNIILLYPAIINFILCLLLFGRSGIILSFLILLFVVYVRSIRIFLLLLFFGLISIYYYLGNIVFYLDEKTNFAIGLESERSLFRKEYMKGIFDSYDFLIGRKIYNCCAYIQSYGNPHNSFIMGHLRYGIFHTVFFIVIMLFVVFKKDFIMLFFLIIIYSRYFLDQLGLFTSFDFVLFSLLFVCILGRHNLVGEKLV
ncbi:hypothetical protein ABTP22_15585 [Acinetobacter baumannii]